MIEHAAKLVGERVDGSGSIEHPLRSIEPSAALDVWHRLQIVTSANDWRWHVES